MRRRTYLPLLLVAAPGAMALGMITPATAYAAGNGVANKGANQIAAAASKATLAATGFTYTGTVKQSGASDTFNLSLTAAGDGQGSVTLSGDHIKLIKLGGTLYLSSNQAFWTSNVNAEFATQVGTGWGSVATTDATFQPIASLLDAQTIVTGFLSPTNNTFTKGKTSTVNGQRVIALGSKDKADESSSGTVYIATTGQPYIVKAASSGNNGSLTFRNYNKPAQPTAPPNPIAIPSSSSPSTTG